MGSIISSGVGSGLDVAGLVQKLVDAEGAPKALRLNTEEARVQAKLSALGSLRSALASFRDTVAVLKDISKFQGRKVTLSAPEFIAGTASSTAVPASYSIEVQELALAHKLQATLPDATAATVVGTGTLRIVAGTTGGQIFDIVIDSSNSTLAGIAKAINQSPAGAKVTAAVVYGTDEARLTISARATGATNALTVTQSGGDGGLAALVALDPIQAARDARVLIDGVVATSTTNTISGAIAGVDVTLTAENELGATTDLTVGYDRDAARKTIDELVKSYNAVVDAIKSVSSYNAETKQGGPLFGDAGVRNIVYQLRRELTANVTGLDGPFDILGEIGISAQLDGKLSVDSSKLDAAFAVNFDAIGALFAAPGTGVAVKIDKLLDPYLQSNGVFDSRSASLKTSIDDIGDRRAALNQRLIALQTRYTKQFNALDGLLTQMQSTSNFLNQQLSNLPGSAPLLKRN